MSQNQKNYDVIIIGAGPSGIFCAYKLIEKKPDMKILMMRKVVRSKSVYVRRERLVYVSAVSRAPSRPDLQVQAHSPMENCPSPRMSAEIFRRFSVMTVQCNSSRNPMIFI